MKYLPKLDSNTYIWNPWHGCNPCSIGCEHCYVFANDSIYGKDATKIYKASAQFKLPISKQRAIRKDPVTNRCDLQYRIPSGSTIDVCNSSDFFIEEADSWRQQAWDIIYERSDCLFRIITKRPENIEKRLPSNWENGYNNVALCVTVENEELAWERIPKLLNIKAQHIGLWLEPLYEDIDIRPFLSSYLIEHVAVGGERYTGLSACSRPLHLDWVKSIREQCKEYDVTFRFIKTGSYFLNDSGKVLNINKWDEKGLADFYKLDIPEMNGINWNTLPQELVQSTLDEEAYKLYSTLKDEYLYFY